MGLVQRIFYFHVPAGLVMLASAMVCGIASAVYLARRRPTADRVAFAAAELAVVLGIIVLTTVPAEVMSDRLILEWYRVRWQVELAFKRLKSLAGLGHLPKYDAASSRAWLYGKLLVALLTERMQRYARAFSPWGTRWFDQDAPEESLA